MCGFLGEFLFEENRLTSTKEFQKLLSISKHRGPDSTETIAIPNFQLGFNRLAILDLSPYGNQPMESPSKRFIIVFNGEIYNYKALAAEYQLTNLYSTSDTEVIVHLLDKIGIQQTISVLNGMFAIGIIDTHTTKLYLARDYAGIKPIFYGVSKNGIVFASQFNQVFKHPFFIDKLQLRNEIVKEYFGLGYMQAPNTIYQHIYQLKPGEIVRISDDGTIKKKIYCQFNAILDNEKVASENENVEKYNTLLGTVINRQLLSDVPLAAFLSGGIDSPLICSIAKKQLPAMEGFTLGIDDEHFDESNKAAAYANHLQLKQHIERMHATDLVAQIDNHFKNMPEPFGDYSSIPTYLITKLAKKQHTVMLSGDGGDELFFGYPRMQDVLQKRHWFKIPYIIRKPIVRLAIKLKLINSWAPYSYRNLEDWVIAKHLHISPKSLSRLFPGTNLSKELIALYQLPKKQTKKSLLHWLRFNEFYAHMQRVLIKVDRMSMANSLEVRVPFLDKESIAFAWKIIPKFKNHNFELKRLLKKVMVLYFPNEMIATEKKGFAVPIDDWLKNELKSDVEKVVFETYFYGSEMLDVAALKKYVTNYFDGKHHEAWGVWHVYAWQKWAIEEGLVKIGIEKQYDYEGNESAVIS